MAVRVDTVVEEPRDAGGAALYELHEALLAVFRELDDFVQLLAVAALDSIGGRQAGKMRNFHRYRGLHLIFFGKRVTLIALTMTGGNNHGCN